MNKIKYYGGYVYTGKGKFRCVLEEKLQFRVRYVIEF
jgi:hypothetical protein